MPSPRLVRPHLESLEGRQLPSVFTVTNTHDGGPGSFRQAILDANDNPDVNEIDFALPAGDQTIRPASPLPAIVYPVTMDGGLQVELSGSDAGPGADGLTVAGGSSQIRGLVINGFDGAGLHLKDYGYDLIAGNYLGTDRTGTEARGNRSGVWLDEGSSFNTIGGADASNRNLLSGNIQYGVLIRGRTLAEAPGANVIGGNYIGTDVNGTTALGNGFTGVDVDFGSGNTIGGTMPGMGNLISGNGTGVFTGNQIATRTQVLGNLIGTDETGEVSLGNDVGVDGNSPGGLVSGNLISGNSRLGVSAGGEGPYSVTGNWIGVDMARTAPLGNGTGVGIVTYSTSVRLTGNVISGNFGDGVVVTGGVGGGGGHSIWGNWIGTDPTDSLDLGNGGHGIFLSRSGYNHIGGEEDGQGNVIAFNGGDGVRVDGGIANAIAGNFIYGHANGLGIRLVNHGNRDQPAPALDAAVSDGDTVTVTGGLAAAANTTFRVEFFANAACHASGYGEGEVYMGFATVRTDGAGQAEIDASFSGAAGAGAFVTATAADPSGNTSEFSACQEVTGPGAPGVPRLGLEGIAATWPRLAPDAGRIVVRVRAESATDAGRRPSAVEPGRAPAGTPVLSAVRRTPAVLDRTLLAYSIADWDRDAGLSIPGF